MSSDRHVERVDVLVFEDTVGETEQIVRQLGLQSASEDVELPVRPAFQGSYSFRRARQTDLDRLKKVAMGQVMRAIEEADPKLVVFDYLLSGTSGSEPYDGMEFANECKQRWRQMGVIVATSGGEGDLRGTVSAQAELDKQLELRRQEYGWSVDYAWVKPWSGIGRRAIDNGLSLPDWSAEVAPRLDDANPDRWKRPSEH